MCNELRELARVARGSRNRTVQSFGWNFFAADIEHRGSWSPYFTGVSCPLSRITIDGFPYSYGPINSDEAMPKGLLAIQP
jgi:hypothetical protein